MSSLIRHFYDVVETNVRGLKVLGVPQECYGALLSSVVISKLPPEIRLIPSREMDEKDWKMKEIDDGGDGERDPSKREIRHPATAAKKG